jgi:hypothetical protein
MDAEGRVHRGVLESLVVVGAGWGEAGADRAANVSICQSKGVTEGRVGRDDDECVVESAMDELRG